MLAKYKIFENQLAMNAVGCISSHSSPAWLKVRKARFLNKIREELEVYRTQKLEVQKKFAKLDHNNDLIIKNVKTGEIFFKTEQDKKKCTAEIKELQEVDFELPEMRHSWIESIDIPDAAFGAIIDLLTLDVEEKEPEEEDDE